MLLTVLYFEAWNFKEFAAKEKLEIVQSERVASPPEADRCDGRKGGLGGIPPALQILGEICSNFFERTPPSSRRSFSEVGIRRDFGETRSAYVLCLHVIVFR